MDFHELLSFRKMITPTIIQILFWIGAGLAVIAGFFMIIGGLINLRGGGAALVFLGLLYICIGPIVVRIYCELIILLFKIYVEIVLVRKAIAGPEGHGTTGFPVIPVAPASSFPAK